MLAASNKNLECADNGGALDLLVCWHNLIQSGIALRLPPHGLASKVGC